MSVNINILISVITICCTIYGVSRNFRKDAEADAGQIAIIVTKLDNIQSVLNELKADVSSTKNDIRELDRRLVAVERSAKQAHKRIDDMQRGSGHIE